VATFWKAHELFGRCGDLSEDLPTFESMSQLVGGSGNFVEDLATFWNSPEFSKDLTTF
jgi:hypothetical protein